MSLSAAPNHPSGNSLTVDLPEPWRIKVVEPIRLLSSVEREQRLADAHLNLFRIRSEDIFIDLLTDSGTSAMSDWQWAGLMQGDEAYAGGRNYYHLEETVREVFGMPHMLPVHQGRVAENLLFSELITPGSIVPSNNLFDTTRAHVEFNGAEGLDLVIKEASNPAASHPFKGNIDLERVRALFQSTPRERIPLVVLTLTDNRGGGQPVSLENLRSLAVLCREFAIPLYLDACRFAENAWFIKQREPGQEQRSIADIAKEMFSYADGCTMSAKKDGLANIGGFIASRSEELIDSLKARLILFEGFPTYGGLAGRDLEAMARGLREVLSEDYLRFRIGQVEALGNLLTRKGIPIIQPPGGHAIYIDSRRMLPHIPPLHFPGHALAVAMYRAGGIRSCEIGSLTFGQRDKATGEMLAAPLELNRIAIPRRVYTNSHLQYVADILGQILARPEQTRGVRITYEPTRLRHYTARYAEIGG